LRSISDGVLTTNVAGLVEFCNPVAERLTGWTAEAMQLCRLSEVVCLRKRGETSAVEINPELIAQNNSPVSSENDFILVAKDGSQTEVEYCAAPLKHSDGNVVGIILVIRNVAARQKALAREQALQQRLSRAQRMETVGMLANGVAKQLHGIIGPIVEYPNLILNKMPADNDIKQDLAMI
jgi:PAS domain S-box-containing protein